MIIADTDRVETMTFTLPIDERIWATGTDHGSYALVNPTSQARFVEVLFDDYAAAVAADLELRQVGLPWKLTDQQIAAVGVEARDGWEVWQSRFSRLIIEAGDGHGDGE